MPGLKVYFPQKLQFPTIYSGVYDFLLSDEYNRSCIKNVQALPSFIKVMNSGQDFETKQNAWIQEG